MINADIDLLAEVDVGLGLDGQVSHLLNYSSAVAAVKLPYSDRVLLSVLLAHSDEFGVVSRLGLKAVSNFSGLKKDVLRNRLDLLVAKQFVRAIVPGVTGGYVFEKQPSVYILNLSHPCFIAAGAGAGLISIVINGPFNRSPEDYPAYNLLRNALRPLGSKLSAATLLARYGLARDGLKVFDQAYASRFEPMLQSMVNRHASYFLSQINFDDSLIESPKAEVWVEIKKRIILELKGDRSVEGLNKIQKRREQSGDKYAFDKSLSDREALLHKAGLLILEEVRNWALDIRRALDDVSFPKSEVWGYYILPRSKMVVSGFSYLAILARTKLSAQALGCYAHLPEQLEFLKESDIPIQDRYTYGLLSQPKKRLKLSIG